MKVSTLLAIGVLLAATGLIVGGAMRTHMVYENGKDEFGLQNFVRIKESQLIEDATFTGVKRIDGKMTTMYDRSAPRTKRACPT